VEQSQPSTTPSWGKRHRPRRMKQLGMKFLVVGVVLPLAGIVLPFEYSVPDPGQTLLRMSVFGGLALLIGVALLVVGKISNKGE
jgi:hypothetical protein